MNAIIRYNKARIDIENRFLGLPHEHSTLIKSLITKADPSTGIVSNITYNELARLLTVHQAPGRKNSGTPTKQTIRNYIKSIERECEDYFQIISEDQNLQFLFPELPKIFKNGELNTDITHQETVIYNEKRSVSNKQVNTEINMELNTPINAVKNIININNNNNKKTISNNFTPNAETISRAKILGYINVEDQAEIQNFIAYNKASGAQWADFNPIYLRWLAKSLERQQQNLQIRNTGSFNHEKNQRSNSPKTNKPSARERVIQAYANEFTFCEETRRFDSRDENEQRIYCDFVAAIN